MSGSSEQAGNEPLLPSAAGIIAVDPRGRIVAMTPLARQLLSILNVGWDRGGYVGLRDKDLDRALKSAIRQVATERLATPRAIRLAGQDGAPPMTVVVDVLEEEEGRPRRPVIVLCRAAGNGGDAVDLLIRRYRLSRAEASVAVLVARGLRPSDVAIARGVSVATVRTQLKAVFNKMECQSQGAIVRLVGALLE